MLTIYLMDVEFKNSSRLLALKNFLLTKVQIKIYQRSAIY